MISMLNGLYVEGYVTNEPKISHTNNDAVQSMLFLNVRQDTMKKDDTDVFTVQKKYTTLPIKLFGSTAVFFKDYIIKGQRILVEYSLDTYRSKSDESRFPHPYLVGTSIRSLETTEVTKDRLKRMDAEKVTEEEAASNQLTDETIFKSGYEDMYTNLTYDIIAGD